MEFECYQANELAGLMVVETLAFHGIREVVISPGSRSTPLTCQFAKDKRFDISVVVDERSASFFALGRAKATGQPTVLICTSGTASANYLPAVIEARYSHTPLLVLSADRSLIDQHCHSGQTIQQPGMFANFVNHEQQLELPVSSSRYLKYLRETLREALKKTRHPNQGVVHLNFPFDKPLEPVLNDEQREGLKARLKTTFFPHTIEASVSVYTRSQMISSAWLNERSPILLVIGANYDARSNPELKRLFALAEKRKIPILTDVLNSGRGYSAQYSSIISTYEWLLNNESASIQSFRPRCFLQWGNLPTSNSLRKALSDWDCMRISIGEQNQGDNHDPSFSQTLANFSIEQLLEVLEQSETAPSPEQIQFFDHWSKQNTHCRRAIASFVRSSPQWTESRFCHQLTAMVSGSSDACDLFISNSMIIRDMENFFQGSDAFRKVFSNRGANGIDGIISTAIGATDAKTPLVCLVGDLTFLHDAGGLKLSHSLHTRPKVLFIVLDNDGGGIFEHLPIASDESVFETYFACPQSVELSSLCDAYGIAYTKIKDDPSADSEIEHHLRSFLAAEKKHKEQASIACIHLKFDRKRSYEFRKSFLKTFKSTI